MFPMFDNPYQAMRQTYSALNLCRISKCKYYIPKNDLMA